MRIIKLLLLTLLFASCSSKQSEYHQVKFFEILGEENEKTLNLLISDFENNLLYKNYPNLDANQAYKQFLIDIKDGNIESWWDKISEKGKETFKHSRLRLEVYKFPDSVWFDEHGIYSSFLYNESGKIIENGSDHHSVHPKDNIDSIIKLEYNRARNNHIGKYFNAIGEIKNENEFFKTFYDIKETAGYINPEVMAEILLKTNPNFSDPVVKSLILMEFVYLY